MKKSMAYHLAQIAVMASPGIAPENKLEILRILMDDENVALYCESKEAEQAVEE